MQVKTNKQVVGFTCGAFDLLHPGHMHLLSRISDECDFVVVGLHTDPSIERPEKNKPVQSTFERYIQLMSLRNVNQVIPYDTEQDLINILATVDIHKRFLGTDYRFTKITGESICHDRGIELIFIPRLHSWSSSELRGRLCECKREPQ